MRVRATLARGWFGPPDWLAAHTSARQRRAINFWLFVAWLGPGTAVWVIVGVDAVFLIAFMSLFALWWSGWTGIAAETPVEVEGADVDVEHADAINVTPDR